MYCLPSRITRIFFPENSTRSACQTFPGTGASTYLIVLRRPFSSDTSGLTHQGKVPLPDCLSTLGLLGAEASASTDHLGEPRPVTPERQPAGSAPGASRSNETVSA